MMEMLTIAVAKGRLGDMGLKLFADRDIKIIRGEESRKLVITDTQKKLKFIFVKPSDVVTYVEKAVADLGIVGKDIILEENKDVYELLDLKYGRCRFAIAGLQNQSLMKKEGVLRIASKYPNYAQSVFEKRDQKIEIIKLNGSVELAPLMDLSDVIVDIVETGNTLRDNGLEILEELDSISARLIANKVSYRFKYDAIRKIEKILGGGLNDSNN